MTTAPVGARRSKQTLTHVRKVSFTGTFALIREDTRCHESTTSLQGRDRSSLYV